MLRFPELESTNSSRDRARHAREGTLTLQVCGNCGTAQYPSREVCRNCLSGALSWSQVPGAGTVVSAGIVHASLHPEFRDRAPWRICSVLLDAGPIVIAHAADAATAPGDIVAVHDRRIGEAQCVLIAEKSLKQSPNRERA